MAAEPLGVDPDAAPEPAAMPIANAPIEDSIDEPQADADEDESFAEATMIEPRSGPEAEERAYEEAVIDTEGAPEDLAEAAPLPPQEPDWQPATEPETVPAESDWREPPEAEAQVDEFSPFADREDEEMPRSRSKIWLLLFLLVLIAGVAAAFWFLAPAEWKARVGLSGTSASPLALVTTHMDRQRLESGNELLTVTGRVINPTTEAQSVPPLQAQLRSSKGALVYSWTIAPPARTLAPGASASFNSAEVNVPPGGEELTITVGPPKKA